MGEDFINARLKDIEHIKEKYKNEDYLEVLQKKWSNNETFTPASDIMDSLTHGKFRDYYGMPGHGQFYFASKMKRQTEVFANIFELYSAKDSKGYEEVKEHFPNQVAAFEKVINKIKK